MVNFVGRSGELALFSNGSDAAVVNTSLNLVVGIGEHSVLSATREWQKTDEAMPSSVIELAAGAVTTLDIKVITAAAGRAYTIPDGVKAEAKKALEWRKEHKRGGTPVGLNTARTLARGGQIGIEKIRHIAKYFPRHEVDKKGKGWKPGDDKFPSNGRIAWALWGGDSAWRWAKAIVERENKKSLTAGGYALPGYHDSMETYKMADDYDANLDAFKMAHTLDPEYGPEFMARVCMDGSGIDRLYKVDYDGKVCVWDGRGWDDLGYVDGDIWTYDRELDDEYDHVEKDHFVIDPESAVVISARLQESPFKKVSLEDLDPEEAMMMAYGLPDEDWQMVDYALTAAGDSMSGGKGSKPTGATKAGDGQYTAAERSNIAKGAPRDATGKFAKTGGRAVVGNNPSTGAGTIMGRSKTPGNILFKKDSDGQTIDVPAKYSTPEDQFKAPAAPVEYGAPLDTSGILGEPRTSKDMPGAQLKGTLPPMTPQDMQSLLNDWPSYVQKQRESFTPTTEADARQYAKDTGQKVRSSSTTSRRPITTFKDGKLVQQNIVSKLSKPGGGGVVAQKAGTSKARKFGDDNRDNLKTRKFGDDNRDNLKSEPKYKPIGNNKTAENAKKGLDRLMRPLSGRGPVTKSPAGGKLTAPLSGRRGTTVNPQDALRNVKNEERKGDRESDARERLRNVRNAERKAATAKQASKSQFDDKGRYIVQKGDNLWSISDKNKPKDQTTAQYWNKVVEANKGKLKSGNPNLIYSGERVTLPGVGKPKPAAPKLTPSQKMNAQAKEYGEAKKAGIAKAKAQESAKMNADAKEYGEAKKAGIAKAKAESAKINADAKQLGEAKKAGIAKAKAAENAKRNADAKEIGTAKLKAAAKVKADNAKRNADAKEYGEAKKAGIAKKRNDDAKAYGQGIMKGIAKDKAQQASLDDKGRYIVKKGDSLWSIADKNKPSNDSTASYWAKVMKANPKENFKSGNPSLIYSGERVNLPGVKKNTPKLTPSQKMNAQAKEYGEARLKAAAKVKADNAKRNADAKEYGEARKAGVAKGKSQESAKINADAKQLGEAKKAGIAKSKAQSAKANADAKQLGEAKKASQPKATPKPLLKPVKSGVPKSLQKPAPAKQSQENPIRKALEGLKDRTAYKQETFKPKVEQKPAKSTDRPKLEQRPAVANAPKTGPVKRGKAGTRKRG